MIQSPKRLFSSLNFRPNPKLGQNFLNDPSTAEMIVRRSQISPENVVLEIGSGLGALTLPLAMAASIVYAVEIDKSLLPLLKDAIRSNDLDNVTLIDRNFLWVDLTQISKTEKSKLTVVGNLPYNISSQILIHLISFRHLLDRCILMFQKEFAQRLSSPPGTRSYGRISVMLQYCAEIRSLANVKASVFYPKPRVDSEVIEIRFKDTANLPAENEAILYRVIKAAFSKRRKTLKNSLAGNDLFQDSREIVKILESVGIDPIRRAETLTVEEFVKLSNAVVDK
jgi:16S rRNA (adenine1518-N6/adenine1519-N6)-dimethyltransferase